jgi:hypothetical protein
LVRAPRAQPGVQPYPDISAEQRARSAREQAAGGTLAERGRSLVGLFVFLFIAWLLSVNRARSAGGS